MAARFVESRKEKVVESWLAEWHEQVHDITCEPCYWSVALRMRIAGENLNSYKSILLCLIVGKLLVVCWEIAAACNSCKKNKRQDFGPLQTCSVFCVTCYIPCVYRRSLKSKAQAKKRGACSAIPINQRTKRNVRCKRWRATQPSKRNVKYTFWLLTFFVYLLESRLFFVSKFILTYLCITCEGSDGGI